MQPIRPAHLLQHSTQQEDKMQTLQQNSQKLQLFPLALKQIRIRTSKGMVKITHPTFFLFLLLLAEHFFTWTSNLSLR